MLETAINRTPTRLAAVAAALVLLLAACGGDDGSSEAGADRPTTAADDGPPATDDAGETETEDEPTGTGTTEQPPAPGPAVPSPGCEAGGATTEVVDERHELAGFTDEDGSARWFLLTAPESTDPVPLVVDFHGLSEGAQVHTQMSAMGPYGLEQGFATAFPQGTGTPVSWKVFGGGTDSPDSDYVTAVLDEIGAARCIDTSRVYATGLSNGAMMTSFLACTMADRFAAFAPVAGLTMFDGCDPARPAPILAFHGTADPILLFNGGVGDLSVITGGEPDPDAIPEADLDGEGYPETARQWAEVLGCGADARDEEATDEILIRSWDCPDGVTLELVIVIGGGHSWPGSEFSRTIESIVGPTTTDIDANEAMWALFQRHRLPD